MDLNATSGGPSGLAPVLSMEQTMPGQARLQAGGHGHDVDLEAGLDFINTLELEHGKPVDHIPGLAEAVSWLTDRGLLHPEAAARRFDEAERQDGGSSMLEDLRRARGALRELVDANAERRQPSSEAIDEVNRLLRAREILILVPANDGVTLGHRHEGDPIDDALARLAEPIARTVSQKQRERLKICADDQCRWVFYDGSRPGRRRWCDMASCGNRAKVARHRARRHEEHGGHDLA